MQIRSGLPNSAQHAYPRLGKALPQEQIEQKHTEQVDSEQSHACAASSAVPRVAVMMSSYNGETFIAEQIESILDQSDVQVTLYIRDDGSVDATKEILDGYRDNAHVHVEYGAHLGVGNSFMQLLWSLPDTYDYYAFSDQDDIWMQDKLAVAIEMLEREDALLYASNLACTDKDMNFLSLRYESGNRPPRSPLSRVARNGLYGCTQVFGTKLFRILQDHRPSAQLLRSRSHDEWTGLSANIVGKIVYDSTPHICYRRHGNNHSFLSPTGWRFTKRRLSRLLQPGRRQPRGLMAREALRCYSDYLSEADKKELEALAHAHVPANKVVLLKNRKRYKAADETEAWFAIKAITGLL